MTAYWKSVASVLTGSVVAQAIPLLGSLIIARLYTPTEFGIFSVWLGLVMLLAVLLTCRYDMALAIEADGPPRRLAVLATLLITIGIGGLVAVLLGMAYLLEPELLSKYPVALVLIWLPSGVLLAMGGIWQSWAAADGAYRQLSLMRIAHAGFVTFAQIFAGAMYASASALAVAQAVGTLLALVLSIYIFPLGGLPSNLGVATIVAYWKRQRRFPTFSLPADLINTAASQLPLLIVANRFGSEIAGLLALTMKVLGAPIGLLGKSVLDVFKRHAASSYRARGECRAEYLNTLKVLGMGSVAFCLVFALTSETIFAVAFGQEWAKAGTIAVWLLPLFALRFIASPLSYMVYIAEKQHFDLVWQLALLCMTILSLSVSVGYEQALKLYSLGYSVLYFVYLAMSYRFSLGAKY